MNRDIDFLLNDAGGHVDDMLLFVASFDGVLAEYQSDPNQVHVTPARLALLRRLQQLPGVVVAVISGRPMDDLRSRMMLGDDAFYIGLHGLEIAGPQVAWARGDAIQPYSDCMREVAIRLQDMISNVPGVRLERKGPIVALHTREAAPEDVVWSRFQLLSAAADLVNADAVRPLRGHDVLELLPNVGCPRGEAVRTVRRWVEERHHQPVVTMYIGGDVTDDGALRAAGEDGVTAVVGRRTAAAYHLESPDEVDALINELIADRLRRSTSAG